MDKVFKVTPEKLREEKGLFYARAKIELINCHSKIVEWPEPFALADKANDFVLGRFDDAQPTLDIIADKDLKCEEKMKQARKALGSNCIFV